MGKYILAILAFGLLILVHELGHFFAARKSGVKVNEFWIGMGPTLLSKKHGDTLYCLRLLPIGGACVMEGESEDSADCGAFNKASRFKRFCILVAGVVMNFIIGFLLVLFILAPQKEFVSRQIDGFQQGFAYSGQNGLMVGDTILRVNGYATLTRSDIDTAFSKSAQSFDIVVRRDGKRVTIDNLPMTRDFTDENGNKLFGLHFATERAGVLTTTKQALFTSVNYGRLIWESLGMLVSGQVGVDQLSGPIGVTKFMADTVKTGLDFYAILNFVNMVAFISINLGVMNLLPIPGLDGGRILFLAIETLRRKPLKREIEGYINTAGLLAMFALIIFVTGNDIWKLLQGLL